MDERHDEPRHSVDIPMKLLWRQRVIYARVRSVSAGGVFVETETPPTLRELTRMQFVLPPDEVSLEVHGMAVEFVRRGNLEGHPPGVRVQFYALHEDARRAWTRFLDFVRTRPRTLWRPGGESLRPGFMRAAAPGASRRAGPFTPYAPEPSPLRHDARDESRAPVETIIVDPTLLAEARANDDVVLISDEELEMVS